MNKSKNEELTEREVLTARERKFSDFARSLLRRPEGKSPKPDSRYTNGRGAEDFQIPANIHGHRIGRLPGRKSGKSLVIDGVPTNPRGQLMVPDFEPALEQILAGLDRPPRSPDEIAEERVFDIIENIAAEVRRRDVPGFLNVMTAYLKGDPDLPLEWNVELVARLLINLLIALGFELGRPEYLYKAHELSAKYHVDWERRELIKYAFRRLNELEAPEERRATRRELVRQNPDEPTRALAERITRMGIPTSKSLVAEIRREVGDEPLEEAA
jgi:hypothetical protein